MARTYVAVEMDETVTPKGWNLMHQDLRKGRLIRKLRKGGFFANYGTVEELEKQSLLLSKSSDGNDHKVGALNENVAERCRPPSSGSKESSSDLRNRQMRQSFEPCEPERGTSKYASLIKSAQYAPANVLATVDKSESSKGGHQCIGIENSNLDTKVAANSISPSYMGSENPVLHNWHISGKDGSFIPVTEVPYSGTDISSALDLKAFCLFGYANREQNRVCHDIKGWKLEPTVEGRLVIHTETASKVWIQLGKPKASYEQTIRSVLVYMELYSMVRKGPVGSKSLLLQWLNSCFWHWRAKPTEDDLHESVHLMNRLNLGTAHATNHLEILTSAVKHSKHQYGEESDAASDEKPLSFKRNRRHTSEELQPREETLEVRSDAEQTTIMQSKPQENFDSDEEPLILKRATMLKKRGLHSDESDHKDSEVLSFSRADMDHVSLSSRLVDLKRQKYTHLVKEDLLVKGSLQENVITESDELHSRIEMILKESHCEVHASQKWDSQNASSNEILSLLNKLGAILFVAERVNSYAHDGDTVVEVCSQTIDYFSLLKERLASSGKKCNYKRYVKNALEAPKQEDWPSLEKKDLPTGSKLVMCLSFSFFLWGDQANQILDHAVELKPKLIFLIAPHFTCRLARLDEQTSYDLIWEDSELLQNEVMWPWGLMNISDPILEEKGGISPVTFLWSRTDWTTKHRQVASQFGHVHKQGRDGKTGLPVK